METTTSDRSIAQGPKGIVNLGFGLYSIYKTTLSPTSAESANRDAKLIDVEDPINEHDIDRVRKNLSAERDDMQKILDNQSYLAAVLSTESSGVCAALEILELDMSTSCERALGVIENREARHVAREFKINVDMVTEAYNSVIDDVMAAAEARQERFPEYMSKGVEEAKRSASRLYMWAKSFVVEKMDTAGGMTKKSKLELMPYLVVMAYSTEVRMDLCELEGDLMQRPDDRAAYLRKTSKAVDDFLALLTSAVVALVTDTSLLEMAIDFHLHLANYLSLMKSFRASLNIIMTPDVKHKDMDEWDDGLALIREIFRRGAEEHETDGSKDVKRRIMLTNVLESLWWAEFKGTDLSKIGIACLQDSADVIELCHILGAEKDEASELTILPECKTALLQLPPANALRSVFCAKLTAALESVLGSVPALSLDNVARTHSPAASCLENPSPLSIAEIPGVSEQLSGKLVRSLTVHTNHVSSVAVSADGKKVVSGSIDSTLRVWNVRNGQELTKMPHQGSSVYDIAMGSDGRTTVSVGGDSNFNYVRVHNIESGKCEFAFRGPIQGVLSVAISPNGNFVVTGSSDGRIRLWNLFTAEEEASYNGHVDSVLCVVFTPDGLRVVSGSKDRTIKVWNLNTALYESSIRSLSGTVYSVVATPDGESVIAGCKDGTVKMWTMNTGELQMTMSGHTAAVRCVAMFPDGRKIASGSDDATIRVWNLVTGTQDIALNDHTSAVCSLAVAPDGRMLASGSEDNTLKMWDLASTSGWEEDQISVASEDDNIIVDVS